MVALDFRLRRRGPSPIGSTITAQRRWQALVLALALASLAVGGCSTARAELEAAPAPSPTPAVSGDGSAQPTGLPAAQDADGCDEVADGAVEPIADAVARLAGGGVVCVRGDRVQERTIVRRGGTLGGPLVIRAVGPVTTAGFAIRADHVELVGFTVTTAGRPPTEDDGAGILLEGDGLVVRNNTVVNTTYHGILCSTRGVQCRNTSIVDNIVRGADGSGIAALGTSTLVAGNDISASVMVNGDDADGLRFFGTGHRIIGNRIHDIAPQPLPGQDPADYPHVDCFQTFDLGGRAVQDVVIARNVCTGVDNMCLIATAGNSDGPTVPAVSSGLIFRENVCAVSGAQAVYLSGLSDSLIAHNLILPGAQFYGVALERSTRVSVLNNAFVGDAWPYWADAVSVFSVDGNVAAPFESTLPPPTWQEPAARWGVPLGFEPWPGAVEGCFALAAGSPLIDAAVALPVGFAGREDAVDMYGAPRALDGTADGVALADIGPVEHSPQGADASTTGSTVCSGR